MAASLKKIFDVSDIRNMAIAGGGMIDLQVAAAEGVGTFLGAAGSGLAKRHLTNLVDDGFQVDMVI